jgi:hypothetical protein
MFSEEEKNVWKCISVNIFPFVIACQTAANVLPNPCWEHAGERDVSIKYTGNHAEN